VQDDNFKNVSVENIIMHCTVTFPFMSLSSISVHNRLMNQFIFKIISVLVRA
jgi:hypothetical protein